MQTDSEVAASGVVLTRDWTVSLMLGLISFRGSEPIAVGGLAIDPACGDGAFTVQAVRRLVESAHKYDVAIDDLADRLRAFDLDFGAVERTRLAVASELETTGLRPTQARSLAARWVRQGDFLDGPTLPSAATWIFGNPPYVRVEQVHRETNRRYRSKWKTMNGRADLYIGFIEAGLHAMGADGQLVYICPDRWMHNKYGTKLRSLISEQYSVQYVLTAHRADPFVTKVSAYPSIIVLGNGPQSDLVVGELDKSFDQAAADNLVDYFATPHNVSATPNKPRLTTISSWKPAPDSWPDFHSNSRLSGIELAYPTLEEAGIRVAVGIATGADAIFVTGDSSLVECDRLIPILSSKDVRTGEIEWPGRWLVNPWDESGLVDLQRFPKMRAYMLDHQVRLRQRHTARKNPSTWWRTIDRIHPQLTHRPKIMLPDVKDRLHPVLDAGSFQAMHNLYHLTSATWDLEVLGGLLLSEVPNNFLHMYSVKMANGFVRVSAQYLRRIRVPHYHDISMDRRRALVDAFRSRNMALANVAAEGLYKR